MSTFKIRGVYHSLQEVLQVLQADEVSSQKEVKEVLALFSKADAACNHLPKRHPLIVVEGLDGSGKTTITKELAKRLRGTKMSTPGPDYLPVREFFDNQENHVRRAYYSLSNYAAANKIKEELQKNPVILDRFWHSTATYAVAAEIKNVADLPLKGDPIYTWPTDLLRPDAVFFLKVSEKTRIQRLSRRTIADTVEEIRLAQEAMFREVVHETYRRMSSPSIIEVNANQYPKRVVEEIQLKL